MDLYQISANQKDPDTYMVPFADQAVNNLDYSWRFIKGAFFVVRALWPLFILIQAVISGVKWQRKKG